MNHTSEFRKLVFEAHQRAALRDSSSTVCLKIAYESNGKQLIPAITAAIATLGGKHACIKECYRMLFDGIVKKIHLNDMGLTKYPGFGSSFYKGEPDPNLKEIADYLEIEFPAHHNMIEYMRRWIDKNIYPNLALYTAIYAFECDDPFEVCESLMIEARIPIWIKILSQQ